MVKNQTTIFEMIYPTFKITKPIRLVTLFSGYDSQALALKYLGVDYELYKTCEWAVKSIQALKDLHFGEDTTDYSKKLSVEQVKEYLFNKGISSNYNDPMTQQQVNRLNEKQARNIYNNIQATRNLVNIQQVEGEDLEITETDKYNYIMTYSFPCQDLSLAGNRKGMSDTSTRSGMLWEVERILTELKEKPQILLMENVPMIHGEGAKEDFNKWQLRLEELGYKNYWKDLIATDYGIPQTRNRCFMISILGDYNYTFPKPIPLKLKLKDMLEDNVDEKYIISDNLIKYYNKKIQQKWRKELHLDKEISSTICNPARNNINDTFITYKEYTNFYVIPRGSDGKLINGSYNRVWKEEKQVGTINLTKIQEIGKKGENNNLKIRKLTPKECFRLMGVKDEDYEKVAKNQSDSSLYHLAGDSIVVNVIQAIMEKLI